MTYILFYDKFLCVVNLLVFVGTCRLWDVDRDENYVLGMKVIDSIDNTENITCIAYCQAKGTLRFCWKSYIAHVLRPELVTIVRVHKLEYIIRA